MFKNIKKEDVQKHENILEMIISQIPMDFPSNANDGYLLGLPEVLSAEFETKNRIERHILIYGAILEGAFGLNSEVFQEILVKNGFIKSFCEIEELRNIKYFNSLFTHIEKSIQEKNTSGHLIQKTIVGLMEKIDEKIEVSVEDVNRLADEFSKQKEELGIFDKK